MKGSRPKNPLTKYYLQELGWQDLLKVFLPLIILVLTPFGYGFWRTLYGYSSFGPAAAAQWGRTWFLISGGLVILLLLYSLRRIKNNQTWVKIFPWGVQLNSPPGRKRALKWEEIQGITSYSVSRSFLRLFKKTKQYLILYSEKYRPVYCHPDLKDREGLKKIIKKQVYQLLKPQLLQAFKNGKTIPFGSITISKEKLILPKVEIPWDYIEGISVQKGNFVINLTAKNSIEIPIRKIINLDILIHLIKTEI